MRALRCYYGLQLMYAMPGEGKPIGKELKYNENFSLVLWIVLCCTLHRPQQLVSNCYAFTNREYRLHRIAPSYP